MLALSTVRTMPIGSKVITSGVVIAEAGRLGTPDLLAIGDGSAGLVVHLPAGVGPYARGTTIQVGGKLAAPYGQLEIRPGKGDIRLLGTGTLPAPAAVESTGLTESIEGRLVTTTGRLSAKPKKTSGGDLTLTLDRDGASPVKVMTDSSSRITTASLKVGSTYRVVGLVGQRASRSGALDGYRIWLRDPADVVVVTATGGSGTPSPTPGASSTGGTIPAMTIARALKVTDRAVAIDAIVTAPATLLDASGRRIVVQDASAAVEILIPTGIAAPPVGARIHAEGRIGVAYGAPRLRADRLGVAGSGPIPTALALHGPPGEAQEWRLVTISGRVDSVHKLGDRWRAEIVVGGHNVVVVGQAGAGIASSALVEGRTATVTGIARRPFPNATDRRFAVTPRFPADIWLAGAGSAPGTGASISGGVRGASGPNPGASSASAATYGAAATDADLVDLEAMIGQLVRVGGLVVELRPDGFTLDDGTAIGRVILRAAALDELVLVEPDDALNAIGHVERTADGVVVVVDDPGGLIETGDPVPDAASPSPAEGAGIGGLAASNGPAAGSRLAGLGSTLPIEPGAIGLGSLALISAASLAVTVLRRQQARRRLAARIGRRLASFAGAPAGAPMGLPDAIPAERGPSTIHSA